MVQINGKDYVTVAERLQRLHDQHEKVIIETEIIRFDDEIVLVIKDIASSKMKSLPFGVTLPI